MSKEQYAIIIKQYSLILGWITLSPFLIPMGYLMHDRFLKRKTQNPILMIILIVGILTLIFSLSILIISYFFDFFDAFLLFRFTILTLIYLVPAMLSIRYFKAEDYQADIDFEEYKDYKRIDGLVHLYESKSTFLLVSNQGHILFYPMMKSIYIQDVIAIDIIIDEIVHNDVLSVLKEAFWNVSGPSVGPINIKKKFIHSITMNFTLNDFNNPHIYFPIINEKTPINSLRFKNAQERLMQIITTMRVIKR